MADRFMNQCPTGLSRDHNRHLSRRSRRRAQASHCAITNFLSQRHDIVGIKELEPSGTADRFVCGLKQSIFFRHDGDGVRDDRTPFFSGLPRRRKNADVLGIFAVTDGNLSDQRPLGGFVGFLE